MTNEKAIEILKLYKLRLEESVSTELGNDIQAFEMAISALENNYNSAEQTDGDLISRKDLLKELEKWDWQDTYLPIHFAELVADLPSAEKTAEWVNNKCSICDKGIEDLIDSREWYENEKPNYCPFCGAKMKESEEEE